MDNLNKHSKNILFLGYESAQTGLIDILESRGCHVEHSKEKAIDPIGYDLIISFGYRYILSEEFITKASPIVNLHIGFLPYNKGSHPNFWSHFEDTPSGVTIHLIDAGIDTGPYLFRKEVSLDKDKLTFKESYRILLNEIETLFIQNIDYILNLKYDTKTYKTKGTYHSASQLPKGINWKNIISHELRNINEEE